MPISQGQFRDKKIAALEAKGIKLKGRYLYNGKIGAVLSPSYDKFGDLLIFKFDDGFQFVVKTTELSIHVLGTKFNFRNYRDEEEARVSLLEGKVVANSGLNLAEEHSLTPNQRIILDKKTGNTTITTVNASHSLIWTQGLIYFDEEKLPDIAKELERSYNVKINISDDSLRNYRFYGNFTRNEQTIREVLDVLASTNRLTYTMNGKLITLSPK